MRPDDLERQLNFARAINRVARVITRDWDASRIREAMVEIIGETLDVDRTLIYDIRLDDQVAEGLCEWLNPAAVGIEPTVATYPLAVFAGGAEHVHRTRGWMESHDDDVHPALRKDGSAEILHSQMKIASLLWFPFDIEERRLFILVFNQVRERRRWSEADLEFVGQVAELVSMAHLRLRLALQQRERERRSEQLQRLEGLGLLAGGIAHDFNNLLTVILGNASLLEQRVQAESPDHEGWMPMLASIRSAATGAGQLCKQLLTYSGRSSASLGLVELNSTVAEIAKLLRISVGRNAAVAYELSSTDLWVRGDRAQIQQVVMNLLTNASDAIGEQGGAITVSTGAISAAQACAQGAQFQGPVPEGDLGYIRVSDNGVGMDSECLARIFEPFYSTKQAGHGLGLSTVHGILVSHGAGVGVASERGVGTTFTVVFPGGEGETVDPLADVVLAPCEATIVVVDDEDIVRNVCESALKLAGFEVDGAASGQAALARCKDPRSPVDLIVLDLTMPNMDGRQTLAALRAAGHQFPVLMISAYALDGVSFGEDSKVSFLQKPFAASELQAAVRRLLLRTRSVPK